MDVYWIAAIVVGAALLVLVPVLVVTVVRLRRLARSAGSLRAGVDAAVAPLVAAAGATRNRRSPQSPALGD